MQYTACLITSCPGITGSCYPLKDHALGLQGPLLFEKTDLLLAISVSDKPFCKCPWSCHYGAWHRQRLFYPELFITPTNKLAKSIPCMELRQMGQPSFSEHVELFVVDATDYFWWYKIPAKCRTLVYFVCCCPKLFIRQLISFESTGIILGVSTEACSELCYDNRANHVYSVGMAYVSIRCTECRFG